MFCFVYLELIKYSHNIKTYIKTYMFLFYQECIMPCNPEYLQSISFQTGEKTWVLLN